MGGVLPALVLAPLAGAVVLALVPPRWRPWLTVTLGLGITAMAVAVVLDVASGSQVQYRMAGWRAPLGIELRVDALSALMLAMTALVSVLVLLYATGTSRVRGSEAFWPLVAMLWSGLNAVYVTADLFNAYVALELMGLAAVALVVLGGRSAWRPGLRYLFVAVLGSLAYLFGVALVYAQTGTLDMAGAGQVLTAGATASVALVLITAGMALKTALFPAHTWLPSAHAAAPSAVSPLLSALVIKASLYLLIRVWYVVFDAAAPPLAGLPTVLGVLGCVAVVWGNVVALRKDRLKSVVAYSTVAQVGYFFLLFAYLAPSAGAPAGSPAALAAQAAWVGVLLMVLSHALAKAAMFMAAGVLSLAHRGDDLDGLVGAVNRMPGTVLAFAVSGVVLAGMPPTLGFAGKWQLLQASLQGGQWWWLAALLGGGLLTFAYTARVVRATFDEPGSAGRRQPVAVPARMPAIALLLAVVAVGTGLLAVPLAEFLAPALPIGGIP
ncbi:complex I subunit 5 family protein [Pseudactinotalea sp. Z1739]|uniref:complex I subunit 5 family protein n=1 Tax=Pseudactinotalea sp. Z1739 TaxID=3413028 RepID=UPI003C7D8CA9